MWQTYLMVAAAIHFVVLASVVEVHGGFLWVFVMRVYPGILALGLSCVAFGRFMGWPV